MARFRYTDDGRYQGRYRPLEPSSGSGHVFPSDWIGVPDPSFGLDETYRMYDVEGARNPALTYQPSNGVDGTDGYFTHYVNWATGNDTNNEFGSIASPRKRLPNRTDKIPAGSVVEIHGDYETTDSTVYAMGYGTETYPIFVRGVESGGLDPLFTSGQLRIEGTYLIVEGIRARGLKAKGELAGTLDTDYVCFRDCECYSDTESAGGITIGSDVGETTSVSNVVIYDCSSHNFGDIEAVGDEDARTLAIGTINTSYIWILNSTFHTSSGTGIAIYGRTGSCDHTYVAGNEVYNVRQSGIWCKGGTDIIVSQNTIHDVISWPNDAKGMGYQDETTDPDRMWFIYNTLYRTGNGYLSDSGGANRKVYVIGNLFYDVNTSKDRLGAPDILEAPAIGHSANGHRYFINNTIYDSYDGIHCSGAADQGIYLLANNVISNITEQHVNMAANQTSIATCENNLFYQGGSAVDVTWGSTSYSDMDTFRSGTDTGDACVVADPLFVNAVGGDFSLSSSSDAVDAAKSTGDVAAVYALFTTDYGLDIEVDREGTARPVGAGWDIGAYEYSA